MNQRHSKPVDFRGRWEKLRLALVLLVLACAGLSLFFTFRVGHQNNSRLLMGLFTVWVSSPFMALVWTSFVAKGWAVHARVWSQIVSLMVAVISVSIYATVAYRPPQRTPAAMFLLVPLASWILIAFTLLVCGMITRKRTD